VSLSACVFLLRVCMCVYAHGRCRIHCVLPCLRMLFCFKLVFHDRLPFWSYAKGMVTVLLVIPYFGGASYVYKHFIRPYISESSHVLNSAETQQSNFQDVTERNIIKNKLKGKEEEFLSCQVGFV
jgi:hypothetical protein